MIVIDTNVIAYLYVASPYAAQAEEALRQDPEEQFPQVAVSLEGFTRS